MPNRGARVDVDGRGGYRSHTSHSYSQNPGGHGILLSLLVSSCPYEDSVHEAERVQYSGNGDERGDMSVKNGDERQFRSCDDSDDRLDISVDYGRRGFRSQDTSHSSSLNNGVTVDGYWISRCTMLF